MANAEALDELILRLYDAALDEALWPELLTVVADLSRGACTHLVGFELATRSPVFGYIGRYPQDAHEDYALNYAHRDPRVGRMLGVVGSPRFDLVTDEDLTTPDERRRCAVHQEFLPRWKVDRALIRGFPIGRGEAGYLAVHRSSTTTGPFGREEAQTLERLVRHLGKAFELRDRIGVLETTIGDLEAAIDSLPNALMLLDGRGRVIFASHKAAAYLRRADGLCVSAGRLAALSRAETARLQALIQRASRCALAPEGGAMAVLRLGTTTPYQVVVAPLPQRSSLAAVSGAAEVVVLVADPTESAPSRVDVLRALYQLTAAEAKLAEGLYAGLSLQEYADLHGLARDTAKNQLARVFSKTACRKQSELVRLIAGIPGGGGEVVR